MQIKLLPAAIAAATALFMATPAFAEVVTFSVALTGGAEVPANDSAGTGTLEGSFDTDSKVLKYTVTYDGLSGDVTAAHFHAPADASANAPPVVPIPDDKLASPIEGEATLTDEQATDFQNHLWYFNLHTAQYPDGELRGQL
jgi:hypothetical protein